MCKGLYIKYDGKLGREGGFEIISENEVRSGQDKEEPKKDDEASLRFTFST